MKKVLIFTASCLLVAQGAFAKESIQIKGSDTLINLVQKLSEVYMNKNPESAISVTGGGSGTGVAALLNKQTDIANSSRELEPKEIQKAKKLGIQPKELTIAIDALALITNPKNMTKELTIEQIGDIFKGTITNWKQVGGPDKTITLYGRQSNSGTFTFFREFVLKGDYSPNMNAMNGNSQIVEAVKQDPSGIGYVGIAYVLNNDKPVSGLNIIKVKKDKSSTGYYPYDSSAVHSKKYPIARGLNQYIDKTPSNLTKKFIQFELSKEGQKLVADEGFYPISEEMIKRNSEALK